MDQCKCVEILSKQFGQTIDKPYVHLSGCPEDSYAKRYNKMSWFEKIFNTSPNTLYKEHLKILNGQKNKRS